MVRVLKRTMVLDISGLPATLGRFEIAKAVDDLYCENFVVKSVQFMPGKRLHVVFDTPEAKNAAEQFMQATIHGVTCRVVESGPQVQLINIYHYPYEEDNAPLLAVLGRYGEVRDIRYQRYSSSATLSTGNRLVRMVRKNTYLAPLMSLGVLSRRGMRGNQLSATFVARLTSPRTARLARGKCRKCMQEGHVARDCTNPPNVWGTTAANAASDASSDVSRMDASAAEEVPASSSAPIGSWASQVDLHDSERNPASEGLRDNSIISTPQLFSSSGDTAGCDTIAPSGSDNVVDHESCDANLSKVNNVNDKSSKSNSTSAMEVLDHGARDAMQPSCNSIDSNDTACSDVVSETGVEKDPADISNISKNTDNNVNDNNDNNVSVIVVDSGFVPPSSVSNIIYIVVAGNVRPDVSDSHVASDEAVVASGSSSAPPPPASSEVEMVDASAVRKRSRPPGLSDGESSGFAPSLKKGTEKDVRKSGGAGVLSQTVESRSTRSR